MLLGLLFADEAFSAPDMTGPDQLFRLRIPHGLNQQAVDIKDSMFGQSLFRRLERDVHGLKVSQTSATDSWLRRQLSQLGEATGFELPVGPYCFRRGNGEALDNSSKLASLLIT